MRGEPPSDRSDHASARHAMVPPPCTARRCRASLLGRSRRSELADRAVAAGHAEHAADRAARHRRYAQATRAAAALSTVTAVGQRHPAGAGAVCARVPDAVTGPAKLGGQASAGSASRQFRTERSGDAAAVGAAARSYRRSARSSCQAWRPANAGGGEIGDARQRKPASPEDAHAELAAVRPDRNTVMSRLADAETLGAAPACILAPIRRRRWTAAAARPARPRRRWRRQAR